MADLPLVLIVDDARLVRASLAQQLRGHYRVREEGDGEAAWQALVLDQSIRAVISDLQMPKMDGWALLERLRSSKLRRLQQMPFILLSGEEGEDDRGRARGLGVSDFVAKGSGPTEILVRLNNVLLLTETREALDQGRDQMVRNPVSGLYSRKYLELQAAQALSHSARHGVDVSVMVFAFDDFPGMCERFGLVVAEELAARFARMLAGKMRQEDSLGHFGAGQFAVVSPGTALSYCATFAERVRQAVEVARLALHGQTVALTVSIGLASVPTDRVNSAGALLDMAGERMQMASRAGGNRTEAGGVVPTSRPISLQHALELLEARRPGPVVPHLDALLGQLLPLLALMNKELGLTLPLAELERHLAERKIDKN